MEKSVSQSCLEPDQQMSAKSDVLLANSSKNLLINASLVDMDSTLLKRAPSHALHVDQVLRQDYQKPHQRLNADPSASLVCSFRRWVTVNHVLLEHSEVKGCQHVNPVLHT